MPAAGRRAGAERSPLAELRYHWSRAFKIDVSRGLWIAVPLRTTDTLTASSAEELRILMRAFRQPDQAERAELAAGEAGSSEARPAQFAALPTGERLRRVDALDLEPVSWRLLHPDPGDVAPRRREVRESVALYRCFLKLCVLYPDAVLVPARRIDRAWHAHLLDTVRYRADCEFALGRFLDHFPSFGLRGARERSRWRDELARTGELFREHFSIDLGNPQAAGVCSNHGDGADCCVGVP